MADRRQEILDAALGLADEGGLDAVSMRAVAQRVGVTAMALYPHFSGKEALLDGLVGRVLADLPRPDRTGHGRSGWARWPGPSVSWPTVIRRSCRCCSPARR